MELVVDSSELVFQFICGIWLVDVLGLWIGDSANVKL